jgi:hypothetical protein
MPTHHSKRRCVTFSYADMHADTSRDEDGPLHIRHPHDVWGTYSIGVSCGAAYTVCQGNSDPKTLTRHFLTGISASEIAPYCNCGRRVIIDENKYGVATSQSRSPLTITCQLPNS